MSARSRDRIRARRGKARIDIGGLPVPGQQFSGLFGWVMGNSREDIAEIGLRIDA
jgi:hypothetical protein